MELPSSPAVMLSPNARNRVPLSFGIGGAGIVTVTLNEQTACRLMASVTVQPTDVVPPGNDVLDFGVQLNDVGGVPPVIAGSGYVTIADVAENDAAVTLTVPGQVMPGNCTGVVSPPGCVAVPPHDAAAARQTTANNRPIVLAVG